MGLRWRVTTTSLAISLVPFILVGVFILLGAREAIVDQALDQLVSVRDMRKDRLESFFQDKRALMDVVMAAVANYQQSAEQRLEAALESRRASLEDFLRIRLRHLELFGDSQIVPEALDQFRRQANSTRNGQDNDGARLADDESWQLLAEHYDTFFSPYRDFLGYDDVLLIDPAGTIVYSLQRGDELGQRLDSASLRGSALAEGFQRAMEGQTSMADFQAHGGVDSEQRAFLLSHIHFGDAIRGVIALSMTPEQLHTLVQRDSGLGDTAAIYLVGQESGGARGFRSAPTAVDAAQEGSIEHFAAAIDRGLAGAFGLEVSMGRGEHLRLVGHAPVPIPGVQWSLIIAVDLEAVLAPQLPGEEEDFFARLVARYGFHDLMLIHGGGEVFYTVQQHSEYETNVLDGPYADSHLAGLVRQVLETQRFGISDFEPYAVHGREPFIFLARPLVFDGTAELVAVVALDGHAMDPIMNETAGMGETGETYLVGEDQLMRSDSRLDPVTRSLENAFADPRRSRVETASVQAALAGDSGVMAGHNYLNREVLSAYTPIQVGGARWALIAEKGREEALGAVDTLEWLLGVIAVVIGSLVLFLVNRFTGGLVRPLAQVSGHLQSLARGQPLAETVVYRRDDEIGEIVRSATVLREAVEATIGQAQAIADGNYDSEVELLSEGDRLGQALRAMTTELRAVTAKNAREDWFKTGQTQLNERMSGDLSLVALGENVVNFLAPYLDAQVGAFYLLEETEGAVRLKLTASHAYSFRPNASNEFRPGEGLVGQAALEGKAFVITDAPDDYLPIRSGLGETHARAVMVLPFFYEGDLKGVMELGCLKGFNPTQLDFMQQVAPLIGVAVNTGQSRIQTQRFLEQSQHQAQALRERSEQMEAQQGELQQVNEELQSQAEELQSQTEELQSQQEELRQVNDELEARTRELDRQREAVERQNAALRDAQSHLEERSRDLEQASRYKSEFLANMSHELRTPLNSLLILADLLLENKAANLTEQQLEYLRTIHHSGSDLLSLINEILDLSKVEAGKVQVSPEPVDLDAIAETLRQKFQPLTDDKGMKLRINREPDTVAEVHTDPRRLDQILTNLLGNACKFTERGEVSLTIGPADLSQLPSRLGERLQEGPHLAFAVRDTGIGISADKQQQIFEAFQQADGTTSRRFGGTGLGLAISRQLARLLGGELGLESQPGRGSTFTLYLPVRYQVVDAPNPPAHGGASPEMLVSVAPSVPIGEPEIASAVAPIPEVLDDDRESLEPGDRFILIVEDDGDFRDILMKLAREKGFKCLAASDGQSALRLADQYQPHAVILDIGLPLMDGWSVMERLKDNPRTRHIPVHFMSAADQVSEARRMGAIGYSLKPVSVTELADTFRRIEHFLDAPLRNLLVLGDDSQRISAIKELLGNEDEVEACYTATPEDALADLRRRDTDCVVVDLEHPQAVRFLESLRGADNLQRIPVILYADRPLSTAEEAALGPLEDELTVKTVSSPERLLDETTLFLHQVEARLPEDKRRMLHRVHDKESILNGKTVLLVDDDSRNTFALTAALEERNLSVLTADNGREALELLDRHHQEIDLVLMDIMMPEMDGYEAIRRIRAQSMFRQLPVIALTAKAMRSDKGRCIEAGANDYLSKPVNLDKLLSMMRVWLYR